MRLICVATMRDQPIGNRCCKRMDGRHTGGHRSSRGVLAHVGPSLELMRIRNMRPLLQAYGMLEIVLQNDGMPHCCAPKHFWTRWLWSTIITAIV